MSTPKRKEKRKMPNGRDCAANPQPSTPDELSGQDSHARPVEARTPAQMACGRVDAAYVALRSDQAGAQEELFEAFKSLAKIFVYNFFGSVDEDLLQEINAAAFLGLPQLRGESPVSTWFVSLVKNHCKKALRRIYRKQERKTVSLSLFEEDTPEGPGEPDSEGSHPDPLHSGAFSGIDAAVDLERAMIGLPEEQVRVVELTLEGLSDAEIADKDALPTGTVKGRRRLGLKQMRRNLSRVE